MGGAPAFSRQGRLSAVYQPARLKLADRIAALAALKLGQIDAGLGTNRARILWPIGACVARQARPTGGQMFTTDEKPVNLPMEHAGAFVDGIQIAAIVMGVGACAYAVCRLERTFKTWDRLLSEVDEQLKPPAL